MKRNKGICDDCKKPLYSKGHLDFHHKKIMKNYKELEKKNISDDLFFEILRCSFSFIDEFIKDFFKVTKMMKKRSQSMQLAKHILKIHAQEIQATNNMLKNKLNELTEEVKEA